MRIRVGLVAIAAIVLALVASGPARAASPVHPCEWAMYGHDAARSFAQDSGCSTISPLTAPTLAPRWFFPTPDVVSASPVVADGSVFVGDWSGTVYSLPADPPPGPVTPNWTFKADDTNGVAFGRIEDTAAYVRTASAAHPALVVVAGGATLYALDARTGAPVTSICLDPREGTADAPRCRAPGVEAEMESSPVVVSDRRGNDIHVIVGLDVHDNQNVGRTGVVSLSLKAERKGGFSFVPQWKFDPEASVAYHGAGLLTTGSGTGNGCGGVWSSPAVDTANRLVFFGTASCSVDGVTTGERMWGVALDTGALRWSFAPPRESTRFDDDFGASPNLLPGDLVGEGSKDGWYYALDRRTGQQVWATHVGQSGHLQTDFAVGGIIGSTATGTVGGRPAIFATTAIPTPLDRPVDDPAGPSLDPSITQDPLRVLSLVAVDATDGSILWRSPLPRSSYGAPSFVDGVVLVPSTASSSIDAFAADSLGAPLADIPVVGPPSATPTPVGPYVYAGAGTSESPGSPLGPASGVWGLRVSTP